MLSQEYLEKFNSTLGRVKTASGANKFIGFLKPFGYQKHFNRFSKQLMKEQPWLRHAGINPTNVMQHMDDFHAPTSFLKHFTKVGPRTTTQYGATFTRDFMKKHPQQYAEAMRKQRMGQLAKGTLLGAGGLGGGYALLKSRNQEPSYY